jgi:hypothetical protein
VAPRQEDQVTKTSNKFDWTGYAIRLAAWENAMKYDKYRPEYTSLSDMVKLYVDPIYRADGSRSHK